MDKCVVGKRYVQMITSYGSDGLGVPTVSIYFSHCDREDYGLEFCSGCHNVELQKDGSGYLLSLEEIIEIIDIKIERMKYLVGVVELAFIGGEPTSNRNYGFVKKISKLYKEKGINSIMYTWKDKKSLKLSDVKYINRIVTGMYLDEMKDENYILGSTNQEIVNNKLETIVSHEESKDALRN